MSDAHAYFTVDHMLCNHQPSLSLVLAGCEWLLSSFISKQHSAMASPDESAGTEECFSEAQLKAMAGVFQGLLDKALTN